jgi:hypothetical protein
MCLVSCGQVQSDTPTLERLIEVLQRELEEARAREQAAREREAILLQMLQQVQQQNQRLLDMPRSAPAPTSAPGTSVTHMVPRGDMRQRILALLREHPEGLTAGELRGLLQVGKSLSDTCSGMLRDGLLVRVAKGRYGVA